MTQSSAIPIPDTAIVHLDDLVKVFRDFWRRPKVRAVNGLSLDIYPGEVFGLLGSGGHVIFMNPGTLIADIGHLK